MQGPDYRTWLQDRYNNSSDPTVRQQASALLGVVGNDFLLNKNFVQSSNNQATTGNYVNGQYQGYGADGMTKINAAMKAAYDSPDRQYGPQQVAGWTDQNGVYGRSTAGSYSGGGYVAPRYDPNTLAQFDQSEGVINNSLGRLDNQLNIARGNVTGQYDNQVRDLDTQKANAQSGYNTSSTQNSQNLRSNKNTITDQSSNGLRGLMRMLGAYGALGSSDSRVAGRAVADQASQQRAGAGQTFAQNQSDLDTNWGNYQTQFNANRTGLDNWKQNNLQQIEAESLTQRQGLLSKLADIKGQRAALIGGSYTGSAQPYLDQANSLNGQIDNLGRSVQAYAGTAPKYEAKPLSTYETGSGTAGVIANTNEGASMMNTPYLSLLLGRDKKQQLPFLG